MMCSRRRALQFLGTAGCIGALSGCLSPGSLDDYALIGTELDLSSIDPPLLWPTPTAIEATTRVDFTTETKRQYLTELFDTGSVTVQQWPLVRRVRWGTETRPRPTFFQRDGVFYRARITDERLIERERWHFAVERPDGEPPENATVATTPFDLSEPDQRVLDAALNAVYAGNDGFLGTPEFDDRRAVEFHHGLDADVSNLIPSPPFEFVDYENEYFRPLTDRHQVEVPKWTYSLERVAETQQALTDQVRAAVIEHDLNSTGLSGGARDVLDGALSEDPGERYEESTPPSDELSEVLEALDIADDLRPIDAYEDRVDFRDVVVEYRDSLYRLSLIVSP